MKPQNNKFKSRKFLLTVFISIVSIFLPLAYKVNGISEAVTIAVLGILAGVGISFGIIEGKLDRARIQNNEVDLDEMKNEASQ